MEKEKKKGIAMMGWILGIAGTLLTAGIIAGIGETIHVESVNASQEVLITSNNSDIDEMKENFKDLRAYVAAEVQNGVQQGIVSGMNLIKKDLEEQQAGHYQVALPANGTN